MNWKPIETAPKDGTEVLLFWRYLYHGDKDFTEGYMLGEWDDAVPGYPWVSHEGRHTEAMFVAWAPLTPPSDETPR